MGIRQGAPVPVPSRPPVLVLARDHLGGKVGGQMVRVGRGAYLPPGDWTSRQIALATIAGVHEQMEAPHCFSHESAALLWGLHVWEVPSVVHVRTTTAGGQSTVVRRHRGVLPPETTTEINGLPVTTLAQTVVDCARTLSAIPALVVADEALRAGLVRDDACDLLDACRGRGVRRAQAVLRYGDGGAESPWETATRAVLLRGGLPVPTTQVRVVTRLGPVWADMAIPEWRLLVEFDGRSKYTDSDVLFDEKRRGDALAEHGSLLRVTAPDHHNPHTIVTRALQYAPPGFRPTPRPELMY